MDYILEIALPVAINRNFDYIYSNKVKPQIGSRVLVNFGQTKQQIGIIVKIKTTSEFDLKKLKPINKLIDEIALFDEHFLDFCQFCAKYYAFPLGMVFLSAIPAEVRNNHILENTSFVTSYIINKKGKTSLTDNSFNKRAKKQIQLLEILKKELLELEIRNLGFSRSIINSLVEKDLIDKKLVSSYLEKNKIQKPLYLLNDEQNKAIKSIKKNSNNFSNFDTTLIYGVTGSGKTEVYMSLIEEVLSLNKQILLMIPEISLTPQMISRFHIRFGKRVAAIHSSLTKKQRKDTWLGAKNNEIKIIIGTRSSLWTGFYDLGLIIVDEEHDGSYKQSGGFNYNARDLAIKKSQMLNIPIVLGSATPSLETLFNVLVGRIKQLDLKQRATKVVMPKIELLDMRGQENSFIHQNLVQKIRKTLAENKQVILFLNKRGFSAVLKCKSCDWASDCDNCSSHQTVYLSKQKLICHHCGSCRKIPLCCPKCNETDLMFLGAGTEKLEKFLGQQFPNNNILRLDRDNQKSSKKLEQAIEKINNLEVDIILGTQLLVKGHHFPNVDLVCVINSDGAFYSSDFRAEEKLLQQLIQVSGRSGRETKTGGKVLIQTQIPEHDLFLSVIKSDYLKHANIILKQRNDYNLPPYSAMAEINASAIDEMLLFKYLRDLRDGLRKVIINDEVEILGPASPAINRKKNRYIANLVITANSKAILQKYNIVLIKLIDYLDNKNYFKTNLNIDP